MSNSNNETANPHGDLPVRQDLKAIKRLSPAAEKVLHRKGYFSYPQIAELSDESLAELLKSVRGITLERIIEEDWRGQARQLAKQHAHVPTVEYTAETDEAQAEPEAIATPVATADTVRLDLHEAADKSARTDITREVAFQLRLGIDERQRVHNTTIKSVSDDVPPERWAGWDIERLQDFINRWADLPQIPAAAPPGSPARPAPETSRLETGAAPEAPGRPRAALITGTCRLDQFKLAGGLGTGYDLRANERSRFLLTLDLHDVKVREGTALHYRATVSAQRLNGPRRRLAVAERAGTLQGLATAQIELDGPTPPPGLYRLVAIVSLAPAAEPGRPELITSREIQLVQVA